MFSQETIDEIEQVARDEGIEVAALLAVAEIESGGRAFAFVGGRKEPLIRFEGHYFHRLIKPAHRDAARKAGLASSKAGSVKNPRAQADRWRLLDKARKLDRAAAVQSVSWGIGQVMGSHWKALGYASPDALVTEARSSVAGQVRLMVRFIRVNGLSGLLAARDWAGFAWRYNGPAYRKNHYDTKLASAYARHSNRRLKRGTAPKMPGGSDLSLHGNPNKQAVIDLQNLLSAAGFPVSSDGHFGTKTDAALRTFQKKAGLKADGVYGPRTKAALEKAVPRLNSSSGVLAWLWKLVGKG